MYSSRAQPDHTFRCFPHKTLFLPCETFVLPGKRITSVYQTLPSQIKPILNKREAILESLGTANTRALPDSRDIHFPLVKDCILRVSRTASATHPKP